MSLNNGRATPSFNDFLTDPTRSLSSRHGGSNDIAGDRLTSTHLDNDSSLELPLTIPVAIFDGGMGTTLEDLYHQDISSNALWSAHLIDNDPNVLVGLHMDFLRSGSQIFSTATYQCAFETFGRQGYSEEKAVYLMREAVRLADQARMQYVKERKQETNALQTFRPFLGLSLGPYGAILSPAQEFDGLYPPPFGPCGYSAKDAKTTTSFINDASPDASESAISLEDRAESELSEFHLGRLLVFAEDEATWSRIDCIMFESVPLLREGRAIRRATGMLQNAMKARVAGWKMKPWSVSFVFPDGRCRQEAWVGGPRIGIPRIINDMMGLTTYVGTQLGCDRPSAIGINCTKPKFLSSLVDEMTEALKSLDLSVGNTAGRPWLALYPNGGLTYNEASKTWEPNKGEKSDVEEKDWAGCVASAVKRPAISGSDSPWAGVILGGCCKTGPSHIKELRSLFI